LNLRLEVGLSEHSPLLLFQKNAGGSSFFEGTSAQCFKVWCAEVVGDEDSVGIFLMNVSDRRKRMLHRMVTAFPRECPQQKNIQPGG